MKKIGLVLIAFMLLFAFGCTQPQPKAALGNTVSTPTLRIIAEDFPPYNFKDANGKITGQSTEVVQEIMKRLGKDYPIEMMPLSDGYELVKKGPNTMMFSLGRNAEREKLFKWVGPVGNWEMDFYAKRSSADLISQFKDKNGLEIGKSVKSICVVKDDIRHQFLNSNSFNNIVTVKTDVECAKKLENGEVELWFGSSTSYMKIMGEAGIDISEFKQVYVAGTNDLYLAFSSDTPDAAISSWQNALNTIKRDGTFEKINSRYNYENEFKEFLKSYEARAAPLEKEDVIQSFKASISGKPEDYAKVEKDDLALTLVYSNKTDFAKLEIYRQSGQINNPTLKRELDLLYYSYLPNQVDEKKLEAIINLQNEVGEEFNTYRVKVNDTSLSDNEVDEILKNSKDSQQLKETWLSSKKIGPVVSDKIIQLVKMRNEIAHELGFGNYYQMQLILSEKDPEKVDAIFEELDTKTSEAYAQLKDEMDESLSKRYGIAKSELMPWHYQNRFFQEPPLSVYSVNFDSYYANQDVVELTENYYASMNMPIEDVVANSDLYEKPGKYQHAYTTWVDRKGDVRMVANVRPDAYWASTMLHEAGHAAYFKYINRTLPWTLRGVDTSDTEAIALMFQERAYQPEWLESTIGLSKEEAEKMSNSSTNYLRADKLIFSRWALVMHNFEKSMYENPDQDLNKLWWDLVEKYQLLKRPERRNEPDWASKIHLATAPAYYYNYMLGWLIDSQLQHHIQNNVLNQTTGTGKSFYGRKEVGEYLKNDLFKYGMEYTWDKEVKIATGENLTAKYFAMDVALQKK